jgi:kynurenine formamidase
MKRNSSVWVYCVLIGLWMALLAAIPAWAQTAQEKEVTMRKTRMIDLSHAIDNTGGDKVEYIDHVQSVESYAKRRGLTAADLPDGKYCAVENVTLQTHSKTHLDAPWHYGPTSEGKRARTIDEVPLEWCYGNGVVLDFTHKKKGESIDVKDVQQALKKIGYTIKPYDIVLIRTDVYKKINEKGYENMHPGMSKEATLWLIDQGVKVMGIDAWGWDRPFDVMVDEFKSGVKDRFWAAHFAGKEKEYCHVENLANLDQIPKPYGFKVSLFPIKIKAAGGGWVRAVAILEE